MTAQTGKPVKRRLQIVPAENSLLDDLLTQLEAAEAAAREASDRAKSLKTRIESELTAAHPGIEVYDIQGSPFRSPRTLTWVNTVRLDTPAMKRLYPEIYSRLAVFGGRWELRAARGGRS